MAWRWEEVNLCHPQEHYSNRKHKELYPGFELGSTIPFVLGAVYIYIYIYIYIYCMVVTIWLGGFGAAQIWYNLESAQYQWKNYHIIIIIISKRKSPGHDGIHGSWFKKLTSIHDSLALEMNKCLLWAHVPEWMTKGRPHWYKRTQKRNRPKHLQTHNLPTNDLENINSADKGRYLLQAAVCSLTNRKDAAKDLEAHQSYFTCTS